MLHENLRESLFNAEPVSPERQQRFREELAQIVEPRLPRRHRLYYLTAFLGSAVGIAGAACGLVFDAQHRWAWALMLLALTASAGWYLHILRRGAEPLRAMQGMSKVFAGIGLFAAGLLIFRAIQSPSLASIAWALAGLLVVLVTSFINLWNRVITAERTVREHLLRVEYRVAELAARLPPAAKP